MSSVLQFHTDGTHCAVYLMAVAGKGGRKLWGCHIFFLEGKSNVFIRFDVHLTLPFISQEKKYDFGEKKDS